MKGLLVFSIYWLLHQLAVNILCVINLCKMCSRFPFFCLSITFLFVHRGKAFLEEVLKVYSSKFMKASRMLGDQLALAWVVRSNPNFNVRRFSRREAFLDKIGGASVLFLPCSSYNWTPPEGAGQFHGMPLDVKVKTCLSSTEY